jgi:hypothetical protein
MLSGHVEKYTTIAFTCFSVHMQHNTIFTLQQIGIEVNFIPVWYTPVLQILDNGVHKPYKRYLREESIAFMVNKSPLNFTSHSGLQGHGIKCNTLPFSTPGSPLESIHSIIIII